LFWISKHSLVKTQENHWITVPFELTILEHINCVIIMFINKIGIFWCIPYLENGGPQIVREVLNHWQSQTALEQAGAALHPWIGTI
jgi:hypothetical protein